MENNVFNALNALDVSEHVEKLDQGKVKLSYLSWTWAWAEVMKRFPDATYNIHLFDASMDAPTAKVPYMYDPLTGYMVMTDVTIGGVTRTMWLPVMDGANKAMKAEAYTYKTKYDEKTVQPATMFDVNKTIMRCLTKNLAMFGLGLYIYAGEDLPESVKEEEARKKEEAEAKRFTCEDCGKQIIDTRLSTGEIYTRERCADASRKRFGRGLCRDCLNKAMNAEKAKGVDINE